MALLHLHLPLRPITAASSRPRPTTHNPPARDTIITFGKHKGSMLGTLPSTYLIWVSRNLRAGDSLPWAHLADEVLRDPVYQDRIEWESADRVLTGDGRLNSRSDSPVAELLELSGRFGWDNEDKAGWEKVDFQLLGTTRGGRIPRKKEVGFLSKGVRLEKDAVVVGRGKREERRERRREEVRRVRKEVGGEREMGSAMGGSGAGKGGGGVVNPFPGRSALLDKVKSREGD